MVGKNRLGDESDGLVRDQVDEGVAVGKAALEIAKLFGRRAFGEVLQRKAIIPFGQIQGVAGIDQAVAEHINAAVRHHAPPTRGRKH